MPGNTSKYLGNIYDSLDLLETEQTVSMPVFPTKQSGLKYASQGDNVLCHVSLAKGGGR
jgi:hypothetical protein